MLRFAPDWLKLAKKLGRSICLVFELLQLRRSYLCAIFSRTLYCKKSPFPSEPILGLLVPKPRCEVKIIDTEKAALNSCKEKHTENQWLEVEAGQIKVGWLTMGRVNLCLLMSLYHFWMLEWRLCFSQRSRWAPRSGRMVQDGGAEAAGWSLVPSPALCFGMGRPPPVF